MSGPNAEAASLGEDIPCAAGIRGDGPCSFELCPPGIGCRRVREQRQQGEGGTVLGEDARVRLAAVIFRGDPAFAADAEEVLSRIEPVVAALVAQARADGVAEERERIGREIRHEIPDLPEKGDDIQWRDARAMRKAFRKALECVGTVSTS